MSATPLTAGGKDFVPKEFDIEFAPGETGPKSVEIDVLNDDILENKEAFTVSLVSSSVPAVKLGQPSSVEILDNDGKAFSPFYVYPYYYPIWQYTKNTAYSCYKHVTYLLCNECL